MMFFRPLLFLPCLLCLSLPALAETFSLEQAVDHALRVNPGVESKQLLLEQAQFNVGVAQSYFWPRVSLTTNSSQLKNSGQAGSTDDLSSNSWSQGMRVSLSLFNGFIHLNNLMKSQLTVDSEQAKHQQARLELGVNVQLQFLQLLEARETLKTAEESVSRITAQLEASKSFVNVGMAPYLNVLQNEVELAKAQQQVIRLRNDIRNSEVQLNKYLNFSPDKPNIYKGNLKNFSGVINYTEEQAINTALFSRPDLVVAQKSVAMAFKDMNMTMGGYLPRADVSYDNMRYSKDYEDKRYKDYSRSYWSVGLTVTWEIFSGGATTFTALGDRKKMEAMRKAYEDAMSTARTEVIRALLDIGTAKELITVSRKALETAKESYGMANKRYMTHIGTITDLLDAQLKLTTAADDANRALSEYHKARAKFFYFIGRENPGLQ